MSKWRNTLLVFAIVGVVTAGGCSSGDSTGPTGCGGNVNSVSQISNTLVFQGSFNNGQPILVLTNSTGTKRTLVPSDYNTGTATFDTSSMLPGTYTISFQMSCNGGGIINITTKVTSITI